MAHAARTPDEPTLGALFVAASKDLSALVRSEIELAKLELRDDAKQAAKGGAMFGVAALLGFLASILLSFAAVSGLVAAGLAAGWAFLIVAAVYLIVAAVFALVGKKAVQRVSPPERAIRTTKDTVALLKHPRSEG